jgi:TPR repeat protein
MSLGNGLLAALLAISLVGLASPIACVADEYKPAPGNSVEEVVAKANQGDADAQEKLAFYYTRGMGVSQDIGKAIEWYAKAAEKNNIIALQMLGFFASNAALHDNAAKYYLRAAELGSMVGQVEMAERYLVGGLGVPQDIDQSEKWFRKAADQKSIDGYYGLAQVYSQKQNHTEAANWYRKAAEKGKVEAQFNLGVMYYNGEGVLQDDIEAAKWFGSAAHQGDAESQYILGIMHMDGQGVTKNYIESHKWLNLAASAGLKDPEKARDARRQVTDKMSPSQIAEAQKLAREWKLK